MHTTFSRFFRIVIYGWALPLALICFVTLAVAEEPEGSKTEGYSGSSHGFGMESPHGTSPHGKSPHGSEYGMGHGKDYGAGEGSATKPKEGSGYGHGKSYGHGYKKYGHGHKRYGHHKKGHGGFAYGGHDEYGSHGDPFTHVLQFADELGLTDEQVRAIEDKQFEYKRRKIALDAEHRIQHMDLDKLVHSGGLDESAIREVGERMKKTKDEKIQLMIDSKIALLKTLTDEQRKKIRAMHHGGD